MVGIVIVAHGGLAKENLAAIEHVFGAQAGLRAISFEPDHDRADKQKKSALPQITWMKGMVSLS